MIYLTTGANGAGKTLNTLEFVRKKQVAEGRSVYFHGFDMLPEKALEFGWLSFEPKDWQALPDGAILICDECQNEFPVRGTSAPVPEYVRALSEHRKRGFDFFMISQHPLNIDSFVRRLIGSPGWHRHLKRTFGANMVSVLEWAAVNTVCEKDGSGKSAKVSMVPFPKHVFEWYASASLHTGKRSIPRQVFVMIGAALFIPLLGYFAFQRLPGVGGKAAPDKPVVPVSVPAGSRGAALVPAAVSGGPVSVDDYMAGYSPRIPGFPHTAPRFDDVVKPVHAPYPAACVRMGSRCDCFSQQATKLTVSPEICDQIVKGGFFVEWGTNQAVSMPPVRAETTQGGAVRSEPVYEPSGAAVARGGGWQATDADIRAHLTRTNAFASDRQ